jgi:hypothetical protein
LARTGRRYTEEQIIAVLKEEAAAPSAAEVIRRHGVTPHTCPVTLNCPTL